MESPRKTTAASVIVYDRTSAVESDLDGGARRERSDEMADGSKSRRVPSKSPLCDGGTGPLRNAVVGKIDIWQNMICNISTERWRGGEGKASKTTC